MLMMDVPLDPDSPMPGRASLQAVDRYGLGRFEPADQHVDHVLAVGRLEPMLAQRSARVRPGERAIVGADQDARDRALHLTDFAAGTRAQRVEALAVGEPQAGERVERAHLRLGGRSSARCRSATVRDSSLDERPVAQVDLRELHVVVVGSSTRAARARDPPRSQARQQGGWRPWRSARAPSCADAARRRSRFPQRAGEVDLGRTERVARERSAIMRTNSARSRRPTASPGAAPAPSCARARRARRRRARTRGSARARRHRPRSRRARRRPAAPGGRPPASPH